MLDLNKKGGYELADLAGFILIFLTTIIFGFIIMEFTPEKNIEILDAEHGNYLAREDLIDFLSSEENGLTVSDLIILGVKENKENSLDFLDVKAEKFFGKYIVNYWITISKEEKVLKEIIIQGEKGRRKPDELKYNFVKVLKGIDDEKIFVSFTRLYQPVGMSKI